MQLHGVEDWLSLLKVLLHLSKNSASVLDILIQPLDELMKDIVVSGLKGFHGAKALASFGWCIQKLSFKI